MSSVLTAPRTSAFWRAGWLHPLNDRHALEDMLAGIDPLLSLGTVKARLVARQAETASCCSLRFKPNRWWRGFVAGQHLRLSVEIRGVRCERAYSLSTAPRADGCIEITVQRQAGGKVSSYLHDELPLGAVVELSQASGEFTPPTTLPAAGLLLIAAGSGITPMRGLLQTLHAGGVAAPGSICLIQVCRSQQDCIYGQELDTLAAQWPALRLIRWYSAQQSRPEAAQLLALVPDHAQRLSYLCGPAGFMRSVESYWQSLHGAAPLHLERFGAAPLELAPDAPAVQVQLQRSGGGFASRRGAALLTEAERAGLAPAYGCRIGICRSCQCRKRSGTVQDLVSGTVSSEPNEWIRLCVSSAQSDLELDL